MTPVEPASPPDPAARLALLRLAIGFTQGLALYLLLDEGLARHWLTGAPAAYAALLLIAVLVPPILLGGLGRMRPRVLLAWAGGAALVLAGLAAHDVLRQAGAAAADRSSLSPAVAAAAVALVFIGHHLIVPAEAERRPIATYPRYFESGWNDGVQLVLSAGFTLAFWLLLWTGAALFELIGVDALGRLIGQGWFAWPVSGAVFAAAVHLTDVRVGLTRGTRTLVLTLLSWLTPLLGGLTLAFLLALPFTGLAPLWETNRATEVLLVAAVGLIVLVNTAYQDGESDTPRALRLGARLAAALVAPLAAIAAWGLALRVGQYGWTPERITAAAGVLITAAYGAGYLWAAAQRGAWLKPLERTNIAAAFLILGVLLALFTPVADPARLAVADQVRRLQQGRVTPLAFDYGFLRFEGARYGRAALERLAARRGGPRATAIAAAARRALAADNRYALDADSAARLAPPRIAVHPAGRTLPPGFPPGGGGEGDPSIADCSGRDAFACHAFFLDLNGDGAEEILLSGPPAFGWRRAAPAAGAGRVGCSSTACFATIWRRCRPGRAVLRRRPGATSRSTATATALPPASPASGPACPRGGPRAPRLRVRVRHRTH